METGEAEERNQKQSMDICTNWEGRRKSETAYNYRKLNEANDSKMAE